MSNNATLDHLVERRRRLLAELSETDAEMRRLIPQPKSTKAATRRYRCTCGYEFESFIDRALHFDAYESDEHRDGGELIDGKLVIRDTTIVGDPIVQKRKAVRALSLDSFDDIANEDVKI